MRRLAPAVAAAFGVLLVLVGGALVGTTGRAGVVYEGSYSPLTTDVGSLWAFTAGQAWGAALVVVGLAVLAASGGWALGRRSRARIHRGLP